MLERYQRTYAQIDLDAAVFNMQQMKQNIAETTQIMAVVKTDGYGHGAIPIALVLQPLSFVYGFAVATAEEAFLLRSAGITKPILVLGYTFPYSYEELIGQEISITVFRKDTLPELSKAAERIGKKAKLHIKVDTGMARIGIQPDEEGLAFVKQALSDEKLCVEGIFTHFARADETDKSAADQQKQRFLSFTKQIETKLGYRILVQHCSNSAGILEMPQANLDLVRAGITLYGLWPSAQMRRDTIKLKPLLSWYSTIVHCKECQAGTAISYGGTYTVTRPQRIATIPIGYGDGYPRGLSNQGHVLIHGKKAPICGRICMDQFMVDVTGIEDAKPGDMVTLLGSDGDLSITAEELGDMSGRFNYELVCDIGKRVPRLYQKDGRFVAVMDYSAEKACYRRLQPEV